MNQDLQRFPDSPEEASPEQAPAEPRRHAGVKEYLLAAGLLLFSFLIWDSLLWANRLGLGEAVGHLGLMITVLIYLHAAKKPATFYSWACAGLYLFGAVSLLLSGDNALKFFTLNALMLLFVPLVMDRLSLRTGVGLFVRLRDFFVTAFPRSFGKIVSGWISIFGKSASETGRSRKIGAILIGLACSIPVLLILIPLLVSSDAAFAGLISILDWNVFFHGIFALSIGAFAALVLYSLLFCNKPSEHRGAEAGFRGIEPFSVTAFLAAICLAYVLYLVAQFAYFFDGFRGLLPKDYTVAQYARRGFFEMCVEVLLNLSLILLTWKFCRRKEGELPRAVRGLILFLCLVSMVLVGTSISKMVLYMQRYGLTRLRVTTSVFMLFLAVIIGAVALRLFFKRLPTVSVAVLTAALLLFALSVSNVDGMIARHNIHRYQTGSLDSLDMETIEDLGTGAIPYVTELLADPDPEIRAGAKEIINRRMSSLGFVEDQFTGTWEDRGLDIRSWNLVSQAARDAVKENWEKLTP